MLQAYYVEDEEQVVNDVKKAKQEAELKGLGNASGPSLAER